MSSRWMPARRIGGGNRPHGNLHAYRGEKPAHGGIVIFGDRKKDLGHCGNGGSVEEGKGGPFGPVGKKGGRRQGSDTEGRRTDRGTKRDPRQGGGETGVGRKQTALGQGGYD